MEDYLTAPGRYSKQYCQDHPDNELTHACGLCYKTFCVAHDNEVYNSLCPKGSKGMWREIIDGHGITYEIKNIISRLLNNVWVCDFRAAVYEFTMWYYAKSCRSSCSKSEVKGSLSNTAVCQIY